MRTLLMLCLLFFALMLLSGCIFNDAADQNLIVKKKYIQTPIPEKMLRRCSVTLPPSEADYIAATMDQREDKLVDYAIFLLKDLDNCNAQVSEIKKFQIKQITEIEKLNKGTAP